MRSYVWMQLLRWILTLDRAKCRRRREQAGDLVLRHDPPVDAGIGRADRFAFEQHRRASVDQRP